MIIRKIYSSCWFCFGSFLLFFAVSCTDSNQSEVIEKVILPHLDSLLLHVEIDAVSLVLVKGEQTVQMHRGQLLNGKSPNDQTLYEIASLTKTFAGTLLAQAINDNKLKLDDDIRNYLPDSFPNLSYEDHPITFRHLLTHESGLPTIFPPKPDLFDQPDSATDLD